VSWTLFAEMLRGQKVKLKAFLLDQTVLAGLGDLYVDEILFAAGLRPDRIAGSLTTQEIRRLYRSLVETLHDAIKYRGTSLDDDTYVDLHGKPASTSSTSRSTSARSRPAGGAESRSSRCARAAPPPTCASSARSERGASGARPPSGSPRGVLQRR
jgi:hypothetical protein